MLTAEVTLLYITLRPHDDVFNSADSKSINFGLLYHAITIYIYRAFEFYLMKLHCNRNYLPCEARDVEDEDVRAADTMARLIDYGMRAEGDRKVYRSLNKRDNQCMGNVWGQSIFTFGKRGKNKIKDR